MSKKIRKKVVFCKPKKRYVQIGYTSHGPWYNPSRKLEYCPAQHDSGRPCNYSCLRILEVPTNHRYM